MNEQDTGLMEKQYLSSENTSPEEKDGKKTAKNGTRAKFKLPNLKNTILRAKQIFLKLKSPKTLVIALILIIILIALLAFLRLSSKSSYVPGVDIVDFSPTSSAPATDSQRQGMQIQLDQFKGDLEKLSEDANSFPFPRIDLNITF